MLKPGEQGDPKIVTLLRKLEFFKEFNLEEQHELASLKQSLGAYRNGQKIIKQGDMDFSVFVLLRGEVDIIKEDNPQTAVATLDPGSVFGEISLFEERPRETSVVAKGEVRVLKFDGEGLDQLNSPTREKFKNELFKLVIKRLHNMNEALVKLKVEISGFAHASDTFRAQMSQIVKDGTTLEEAFNSMGKTLSKLIHA